MSLMFETLHKLNELNDWHQSLLKEISSNDKVDIALEALHTVLVEMLQDGCNWVSENKQLYRCRYVLNYVILVECFSHWCNVSLMIDTRYA